MSPADSVDPHDPDAPPHFEWFLVIAFHPDTDRIGESARVPDTGEGLEIGRHQPLFRSGDGDPAGLDDTYVSRAACRLESRAGGACLRLGPGRSRLRVNGGDARDGLVLTQEQLRRGIAMMLGPRVLLQLRRRTVPMDDGEAHIPGLLGVSAAMCELRATVLRVARSAADVLLTGPTGSGKERVARALHDFSAHAGGPWVPVNMAALPADIAAASLFGARRGAYTGADRHRQGLFQQAMGGTLFLDEIGDTPESLQPMLLRALQEREVQVVGGPVERVELRVVSATERDLDAGFRPALRFRLGAQEIELPPLVQRLEDVGVLAAHFFRSSAVAAGRRWLAETANDRELARWARCIELLSRYAWPGNVRELEHVVAQIDASSGDRLRIPATLSRRLVAAPNAVGEPDSGVASVQESPGQVARGAGSPTFSLADLADADFLQVWRDCRFEVAAVARRLGVSRAAVYRRLRHMDECRLAADVPVAELLAVLEECRGDMRATAERLAVSKRGLETRLRAGGVAGPGSPGRRSAPAS